MAMPPIAGASIAVRYEAWLTPRRARAARVMAPTSVASGPDRNVANHEGRPMRGMAPWGSAASLLLEPGTTCRDEGDVRGSSVAARTRFRLELRAINRDVRAVDELKGG